MVLMTGIDFNTGRVWFLFFFNNFDREDLKPWGREPAHKNTISYTQPQKVALTAVLPVRSEVEVQADLHIRSAQLVYSTSSCQTALFKNCYSPPFL